MNSTSKELRSALRSARVAFFVSIWFTLLTFVAVWYLATAVLLVIAPGAGLISLLLLLATLLIPLETKAPRAVTWLLERSVSAFIEYLPVDVSLHESWCEEFPPQVGRTNAQGEQTNSCKQSNMIEVENDAGNDKDISTDTQIDKKNKRPYIIAYEPHGVLPLIMCVFAGSVAKPASLGMPPSLDHAAVLASDAMFWVPILRNLWFWLGLRSVSQESIDRLLDEEKVS